jgi:hypothetical protein
METTPLLGAFCRVAQADDALTCGLDVAAGPLLAATVGAVLVIAAATLARGGSAPGEPGAARPELGED